MKTLLVIVCCLVSISAFAQRQELPKVPALNTPNVKPHPADNLPGTELPAMLFPDEKPGGGRLLRVISSQSPGNAPWSVDRSLFLLSLHTDSLQRLVMPPFILTDSLRHMLLLRHFRDRQSLPMDSLHRLVMPPFILTDSLRHMLLLRHFRDRMRQKDTIPHYIIPKE